MAQIMVVDDDAAFAATLGTYLRRRGHTVTLAYDGQEALLRCGEAVPDLLVTDLRMQLLGGAELAKALQARAPALPVVVVTGYQDEAVGRLGPRVSLLSKPLALPDVLARIEALLDP